MSVLKLFLPTLKKRLGPMALGTALACGAVLSSIGLLALSGWFISISAYMATAGYVVASQFNYYYPAAGVRTFSLARIVTRYGERLATHDATFRILADIRLWFYEKLMPLAPSRLIRYHRGELLNRMVNDVDALQDLYIRILSPSIVFLVAIVVVGGFFTFFNGYVALTTVGIALLSGLFIPILTNRLARSQNQQLTQQQGHLIMQMTSYVQSLSPLKIFAADKAYLQQINQANKVYMQQQNRLVAITGIGSGLMTLAFGASIWIATWLGVAAVAADNMSGAVIALLVLGIMGLFEAIMPLSSAYQHLGKVLASAKRLNEVVDQKPAVCFPKTQQIELPKQCSIEYRSVHFCYSNDTKPVLSDFSETIPAGQHVAIVGPTGQGKTTLIQLLARFYPVDSGQIRIGSHPIEQLTETQLRQVMTVIEQRAHIFSGTVRENLAIADPEADDQSLWSALAAVDLADTVDHLPQGLDTWVGDYGQHLSGGQRKRLSLARAFLTHKPILILDEPTEGLDKRTEKRVFDTLKQHMQDKTVILITHNAALSESMDRVISLPMKR